MFRDCRQNVPQSVLSRIMTVAWLSSLASKMIDFYSQESLLEQKIKAREHICVFLPKFHCKLNPIEMVALLLFL